MIRTVVLAKEAKKGLRVALPPAGRLIQKEGRYRMTKGKRAVARFLEELVGPLTFGGSVEAIRLGEESSQADFAARLGVSKQHLCDIEKGRRGVSVERAAAWAQLLGYSEPVFIKLAVQDQLARAGLLYEVDLRRASQGPATK